MENKGWIVKLGDELSRFVIWSRGNPKVEEIVT